MGISLGANQYGKAENRVVRIYRDTARHEIVDLNVSTSLRGDFADAHVDRRPVRGAADRHAEEHRVRLRQGARRHARPRTTPSPSAGASLDASPQADSAQVRVEQYAWDRIPVGAERPRPRVRPARRRGPHRRRHGQRPRRRAAGARGLRAPGPGRAEVDRLGVQGLPEGRVHDAAGDRRPDPGDLARRPLALRRRHATATGTSPTTPSSATLLETFATTYSRALQETLYLMGRRVLETNDGVAEIRFSAPNKHHFLVDLAPFGLENNGEVFIAADRPYGLIEATRRPRRRARPGRRLARPSPGSREGAPMSDHGLTTSPTARMLFTELPLLDRPAAAKAAGFDASSSGGRGRTSRSRRRRRRRVRPRRPRRGRAAGRAELLRRRPGRARTAACCRSRPAPAQFRDNIDVAVGDRRPARRVGVQRAVRQPGRRTRRPREQDELAAREPRPRPPPPPHGSARRCWSSRSAGRSRTRCAPPTMRSRSCTRVRARRATRTSASCATCSTWPTTATTSTRRSRSTPASPATSRSPTAPAAASPAPASSTSGATSPTSPGRGYAGWVGLEYKPTTDTETSLAWLPRERRAAPLANRSRQR